MGGGGSGDMGDMGGGVALKTRELPGKRSTSQPTGTETTTYTTDEYMKKNDTHDAEREKGGDARRYERVGSSVATSVPA